MRSVMQAGWKKSRLLAALDGRLIQFACLKIILRLYRCVGSAVPSAAGAAGSATGAAAAGADAASVAAPSAGEGTVSPGASADTSLDSSSAFLGAAGAARALMRPSAMMSVSCSTCMDEGIPSCTALHTWQISLYTGASKSSQQTCAASLPQSHEALVYLRHVKNAGCQTLEG